jgi:hypothetical protein
MAERTPLIVTEGHLETHFREVSSILEAVIDASASARLDFDFASSPVVAALVGNGCEFISHNRGMRVPVAPLLRLQNEVWSWLSYREEWIDEDRRKTRRFSFRSAGVTVYFGFRSDVFKPQMFRAEWAGWAQWTGQGYSFQGSEAGHPHWQIDVLDSLKEDENAAEAATFLELLKDDAEGEVREFRPPPTPGARAFISAQKLSRIHFASAAPWWKLPPHNDHAHGPESLVDVQRWAQGSLQYVTTELKRL